jgi:hypothetical protein
MRLCLLVVVDIDGYGIGFLDHLRSLKVAPLPLYQSRLLNGQMFGAPAAQLDRTSDCRAESGGKVREDYQSSSLTYRSKLLDLDCLSIYSFAENRLIKAKYDFSKKCPLQTQTIEGHDSVKKALTQK